jgi:hypothetical protein
MTQRLQRDARSDAKVEYFRVPSRRNNDVGPLDIVVDDAGAVRGVQGLGDLGRQLDDLPS